MTRAPGLILASAAVVALLGASVVAPASAASDGELDGLEYVSLGDSYSAGFGLTPYSSTSPFTGDPNGCYQADANYPHNVASALHLALADQTCSGAISANLGYPDGTSLPLPPAADPLPVLPAGSQNQVTLSGMNAPELQIAALSESTDVVTIAIGGNDLGFAPIASSCIRESVESGSYPLYLYWEDDISVDNCAQYYGDDSTYPDAYLPSRQSGFITPRIAATLDAVKQEAPNAQVFVVGYPQIAPADATDACFSSMDNNDAVPFSGVDLRFINSIESGLDAALQAEAAARGFHFVPSWAASANNTLCDEDPWIWGLTAYVNFESSCDAGYIPGDADAYVCVKLGALHPNKDGVANLTKLTTAAVAAAFHITPAVSEARRGDAVAVTGAGFHPGETVRLELRLGGATVQAGSAQADASGDISTTVTVPAAAALGTHALHGVGLESARSFSSPLRVTDAAALAATGAADASLAALLGFALVALGVASFFAARTGRRRTNG